MHPLDTYIVNEIELLYHFQKHNYHGYAPLDYYKYLFGVKYGVLFKSTKSKPKA